MSIPTITQLPRYVRTFRNPDRPTCEVARCGRWAQHELALDGGRILLCTQDLPEPEVA